MFDPQNLMSFFRTVFAYLPIRPVNTRADPRHVSSTAFDVISFNGQGQLCPLTCIVQGEEIFQTIPGMSTVQSRINF